MGIAKSAPACFACFQHVNSPPLHTFTFFSCRTISYQDKELSDYGLHELAERHIGGMPAVSTPPGGGSTAAAAAAGPAVAPPGSSPMQRMRRALQAAIALGEAVHVRLLEGGLPVEVMQREMQVQQKSLLHVVRGMSQRCNLHTGNPRQPKVASNAAGSAILIWAKHSNSCSLPLLYRLRRCWRSWSLLAWVSDGKEKKK